MSDQPTGPHDTPHDVFVRLNDLTNIVKWLGSALVAALVWFAMDQRATINAIRQNDSVQDRTMATISQQLEFMKSQMAEYHNGLNALQAGQQQALVQLSEIRSKGSATEEIARNTQSRVEVLASYLRSNSHIKDGVLDVSPVEKFNGYKRAQ